MKAYYNEHEPFAARWLKALIDKNLIAPGDVDTRDIQEVKIDDLNGYNQVHLFAGIGGWSLALRLAGWEDEREVWTGSCPCQPFSEAGRGAGASDERHLWPDMLRLVRERRPVVCFGEQVADAIRFGWLDRVSADLETENYAVGSVVLGAHSVGAPQIRQRLYWVANRPSVEARSQEPKDRLRSHDSAWSNGVPQVGRCCEHHGQQVRRAPPGTVFVADGISANVARISGFGNAICPPLAAEFIQAYCEATR